MFICNALSFIQHIFLVLLAGASSEIPAPFSAPLVSFLVPFSDQRVFFSYQE